MIKVKKEGIILEKTHLEFENEGVLNPAVIREGGIIHLFYRAVRKNNFSSIGYCTLSDPLTVRYRSDKPFLHSEFEYESQGMEDPRITKIEDLYYLTYTAYDGINALGALAVSKDLVHFDKLGLIVPQITYKEFNNLVSLKNKSAEKYLYYNVHKHLIEDQTKNVYLWDKNVIFFPRRINGNLHFLHRIKPDIQIIVEIESLDELTPEFWQDYFLQFNEHVVLSPKYPHEISYIGGGCSPIETAEGWLIIYHGVRHNKEGYVYSACAALLDLKNPKKEIARLPYPLFEPEYPWELKGAVNNVCFPTGTVLYEDRLYIYYGAADERIACASLSLSELLKELLLNPKTHENQSTSKHPSSSF